MSDDLQIEREGAVLTLTLNRPQAINALTLELMDALGKAIDDGTADGSVRVMVLRGAGPRGFCAGLDNKSLAALREEGPDEPERLIRAHYALIAKIESRPKLIVSL